MDLTRPTCPDPYDLLPRVPSFTLTSPDFSDGDTLPASATAEGGSRSPELHWSGFPAHSRSFLLTCFDPDAPTPSGYWHWCLVDLDASTTHVPAGIGSSDLSVEGASFHVKNDAGVWGFYGAAPPAGDRPHRYIFVVHALDVDTLNLDDEATPATVSFTALPHVLARASLTATYAAPTQEKEESEG